MKTISANLKEKNENLGVVIPPESKQIVVLVCLPTSYTEVGILCL